MTLAGKVAWVTGGGSGIGQAAAVEIAKAGAKVVVTGRRAASLEETRDLIARAGGQGDAEVVDVTDRDAVERAAKAIFSRHGRVDTLVNCAGVNIPKRFFKDLVASECISLGKAAELAGISMDEFMTVCNGESLRGHALGRLSHLCGWLLWA